MERFKVIIMDEAVDFIRSLPDPAKKKISYNIERAKTTVDSEVFKKLTGTDIWELRTKCNGMAYRLLSFWDKHQNAFVVVTHGIEKKTQKTPLKEIEKATRIMNQYYKDRYNGDNRKK